MNMKRIVIFSSLLLIGVTSFVSKEKAIKQETVNQTKKRIQSWCALIPEGEVLLDNKKTTIKSFYFSKNELHNFEYLIFIQDLERQGRLEEAQKYLPDTTNWGDKGMQNYYFRHPSFRDYPVVNISREGAEAFCVWATEKNKEIIGNQNLIMRLPTKAEWIYAAQAGNSEKMFAWEFDELQNKNGQWMANFLTISNVNIKRADDGTPLIEKQNTVQESSSMTAAILTKKNTYYPNPWGLYNMNGNAAEMVSDFPQALGGSWSDFGYDIRNLSEQPFNGSPQNNVGFRVVIELN